MKSFIVFSILFLALNNANGQDFHYDIHTDFKNSISKEKLSSAKTIADIINDYPKNWLQNLISIDISTSDEQGKKHVSSNEFLTSQQLQALSKTKVWSEIQIHVMYFKKNAVTEFQDVNIMDFKVSVGPDTQAKFDGGFIALKKLIKERTLVQISKNAPKIQGNGIFYFTVNEAGNISDVCLESSTNDTNTDILLYETLNSLPAWQPAKTKDGKPVKQKFRFVFSGANGC